MQSNTFQHTLLLNKNAEGQIDRGIERTAVGPLMAHSQSGFVHALTCLVVLQTSNHQRVENNQVCMPQTFLSVRSVMHQGWTCDCCGCLQALERAQSVCL
jgi:hypothetical protein